MKVAINGFGRIGRTVFKIGLQRGVNIVAINDVHGPKDAAYLLKYDSVYGVYDKEVKVGKDCIIVGSRRIKVLQERDPKKLPWRKRGVDCVVESTGVFTDRKGASLHLQAGAKKVLISAPGKHMDLTIVPGANSDKLMKKHKIISVASCTTNCLAPVAKILNDKFGIEKALMTTVHAYTNSQALHDGSAEKPRRGRAAAANIVPTTTGATKAVIEVLPELKGKLDGLAMRVPVVTGSIVDLTAKLKKSFNVDLINKEFKRAAEGDYNGIVDYTEEELVSSDTIKNPYSAIVSGIDTQKVGDLVKILAWYDNEWGYSNRMVDVIKMLR
jgi:glyceraldehyde 3-phosphate dehydrogenase